MTRFGHTKPAGSQPGHCPPRRFFSRPEQRRLLVLVSMLMLVFFLMIEAGKPRNWLWLWGGRSDTSTARGEPVARSDPSRDRDVYFPGIEPADLAKVQDNSVFLSSETEVWDCWLQLINKAPQSALENASIGHVGYVQLFHQTAEYRGRVVSVSGRVRRASYVVAPENTAQVKGYWQCWLFTGERGASPVVVYALRMPDGFPQGMEINEPVEFVGLVYKRWAYQSGSGIRLAPLLLAKLGSWNASVPETRQALPGLGVVASTIEVQDVLARFGIDQSRLNSFLDRRPLDSDEHETLYRVLFCLGRIAPEMVQRSNPSPASWSQVIENPDTYRGKFFRLSGTLTDMAVDTMIPEVVDRFGFSYFYRVQLKLDDTNSPALVAARVVPETWTKVPQTTALIGQRCSVSGMFLKVGQNQGPTPQLVFAADRIAWHPDRVAPQLGIAADHVLLGDLGMDVGLLSEVRDRARIVNEDRECFYQLLSSVEKQPVSAMPIDTPEINIPEILVDPTSSRGKLFTVHGGARRAIPVRVDDPDVQARFGINHYYELDLLVPLDTPLQLVARDGQSSSMYGSYPVTVCVRHLPKGMPVGEEINEEVRVQAFFVKLWAYHSHEDAAAGESATGRKAIQFTPLMIGRQPQWIGRTVSSSPYPGLVFGVIFAAVMAVLCYRVWKSARNDQASLRTIRSRRFASDEDHPLARFESETQEERGETEHETDA